MPLTPSEAIDPTKNPLNPQGLKPLVTQFVFERLSLMILILDVVFVLIQRKLETIVFYFLVQMMIQVKMQM